MPCLSVQSPLLPLGWGPLPEQAPAAKPPPGLAGGCLRVMEAQGTPPSLSWGRVGYTRAPNSVPARAPSLALLLPACGSLGLRLRAVKCRPWPLLPWGLWRISSSLGENPVASGVCVFQGAWVRQGLQALLGGWDRSRRLCEPGRDVARSGLWLQRGGKLGEGETRLGRRPSRPAVRETREAWPRGERSGQGLRSLND